MIADQNFYDTCFTIFYPTASATVEGENWAYGPTLDILHTLEQIIQTVRGQDNYDNRIFLNFTYS